MPIAHPNCKCKLYGVGDILVNPIKKTIDERKAIVKNSPDLSQPKRIGDSMRLSIIKQYKV